MALILLHFNSIGFTLHNWFPVVGIEEVSQAICYCVWGLRQTVKDNVTGVTQSNLLEDNCTLSNHKDWFDSLLVQVAGTLARLLFRVLTYKWHLSIFVFNECPKLDEVEVIWNENNSVSRASTINFIPNLFCEIAKPCCISMLKTADIW